MDKDKKHLILSDQDFINSNKHKYSLKEWARTSGDGNTTDKFIEKALLLTPEDIKDIIKSISEKVKRRIGD